MKAGKFWTPRAAKKIGIRLGPNMRKDGTTDHMDTAYQMTQPRREVVTVDDAWGAFKRVVPEEWWPYAREDPYGGVVIENGMSVSSIEFCYHLFRIAKYLRPYVSPYVLEIGGGYGGMARTILQFTRVVITIVDLEPMLRIQKHYLENTSKGGWVGFATEIPEKRFGFAMNTRSMCEMDLAEVNSYLARLDEVLLPGAHFYSVNHDECINNFKDWRVPSRWKLIDERTFPLPWKKGFAWVERTWMKDG